MHTGVRKRVLLFLTMLNNQKTYLIAQSEWDTASKGLDAFLPPKYSKQKLVKPIILGYTEADTLLLICS